MRAWQTRSGGCALLLPQLHIRLGCGIAPGLDCIQSGLAAACQDEVCTVQFAVFHIGKDAAAIARVLVA